MVAVTIQPPSQITSQLEVPAGIQLPFNSIVTTEHGTNLTGRLQYFWGVGSDGTVGTASLITYAFPEPGSHIVTLNVLYAGTHLVAANSIPITALGESGRAGRD